MSSIQLKQDETDDELCETLERLEATERKTAEAQGKAAQERSLIKQDVDVIRNELNAIRCVFSRPSNRDDLSRIARSYENYKLYHLMMIWTKKANNR